MIEINQYLEQVIKKTQSHFTSDAHPSLEKCEIHSGSYDADALVNDTPAIIFANTGVGELNHLPSNQQDIKLQMVAYLVTHDSNALAREERMTQLQVSFLSFLDWQRWGLPFTHPAMAIEALDAHGLIKDFKSDTSSWRTGVSVLARAADLYSESTQNQMSLWIVSWEQHLRIGNPDDSVKSGFVVEQTPEAVDSHHFSKKIENEVERNAPNKPEIVARP